MAKRDECTEGVERGLPPPIEAKLYSSFDSLNGEEERLKLPTIPCGMALAVGRKLEVGCYGSIRGRRRIVDKIA